MKRWRRLVAELPGYVVAAAFLLLFRILPLAAASALGGAIGRLVGPRLPVTRTARHNLARVFAAKSEAEIDALVTAMWDHLGRVAAELPHLGAIRCYAAGGGVEVHGAENIDAARDRGAIFFSGHIGNWEVVSLAISQRGLPVTQVYRRAANGLVDRLIVKARRPITENPIAKGAAGARRMVNTVSHGGNIAMLVDQKMNDGIAVPFFGREAMTAPALAQLALKFGCPLVPMRCERIKGARFRLTFLPPVAVAASGDRQADIAATMARVNAQLEEWIRARPEQWLWLHKRWPE